MPLPLAVLYASSSYPETGNDVDNLITNQVLGQFTACPAATALERLDRFPVVREESLRQSFDNRPSFGDNVSDCRSIDSSAALIP